MTDDVTKSTLSEKKILQTNVVTYHKKMHPAHITSGISDVRLK